MQPPFSFLASSEASGAVSFGSMPLVLSLTSFLHNSSLLDCLETCGCIHVCWRLANIVILYTHTYKHAILKYKLLIGLHFDLLMLYLPSLFGIRYLLELFDYLEKCSFQKRSKYIFFGMNIFTCAALHLWFACECAWWRRWWAPYRFVFHYSRWQFNK